MIKRILGGIVGLGVLVLAAFLIYAWNPSIDRIEPPQAGQFSEDQISRGRVLAGIGNCETCHTTNPDQPYAGGLAMPTPFGTLYSTNITPHPDSGIGQWSEQAFARSMREGISRSGAHLYPAFPYTHYTKITDADITDLYAYLMTRTPVQATVPENTLTFPFNIRTLQAGWKILFFDEGRYQADSNMGAVWNRGAYLAQGLGHCSACHTPRNIFGAEDKSNAYAGTTVNDWYAPALTSAHSTPVPWTEEEGFDYLRVGGSDFHGVAVGSMSHVVHAGLSVAPDQDIRALAVWLSDLSDAPANAQAGEVAASAIRSAQTSIGHGMTMGEGERIFAYACASCHYNDPEAVNPLRPDMSLNSALTAPDPVNFIRVTLDGVALGEGLRGAMMPGFADALSDAEIASLLGFLRETHTDEPAWSNLEDTIGNQRQR